MHWRGRGSQAGSSAVTPHFNDPSCHPTHHCCCRNGVSREVAMRKQADRNWANGEKFNLMQAFQRQVGVSPPPRRVPLHAACLHLAAGLDCHRVLLLGGCGLCCMACMAARWTGSLWSGVATWMPWPGNM